MITNQEIFDAAWQAFVVELRPASKKFNPQKGRYDCQYRSPEGYKCAIGLCIRDEDYSPGMEMCGPMDLEDDFNIEFESVRFAETAQDELHDDIAEHLGDPDMHEIIEGRYLEFAERWDLEVPEVV